MSGQNRTQVDDLIAAINAANELSKAMEKGRKRRSVNDVAWRDALSEYMENGDIAINSDVKQPLAAEPYSASKDELPGGRILHDKPLPNAEEINSLMEKIRKLIDEPERLLESHLGIFIEPAPPGKMLDSEG